MSQAYITGSSIISSLGRNKSECIEKIKILNDDNYDDYLETTFKHKNYYSIHSNKNKRDKLLDSLKEIVLNALKDASLKEEDYSDLSVYIGSTSKHISIIETNYTEHNILSSTLNDDIPTIVDNLLKLKKPSMLFSTACTSSANALVYASNQIKNNNIKKALVIGLEFYNDTTYNGFNSLMLLSQSAKYMPFNKNSDGLILGEASSALVLENEKKSSSDFFILGSKNIFDNYSQTSVNPNGLIIYKTILDTLESSNLTIKDINFVNVHSPGTQASNEAEVNALSLLEDKISVLSMKPYIGHTLGACTLNELILISSCIQNEFIPSTLCVQDINNIEFVKENKKIKEAIVLFTYNGFGGNNISLIITNKEI